jgi:hypothetical protein
MMNERIKELREQASEFAEVAWAKQTQATWETNKDIHTFYDEKFAELIVRECVKAADEWYQYHNEIQWDPGEHIKQHFGVEE